MRAWRPSAATRASAPPSRTAAAAAPRRSTGAPTAASRCWSGRSRTASSRGCSRPARARDRRTPRAPSCPGRRRPSVRRRPRRRSCLRARSPADRPRPPGTCGGPPGTVRPSRRRPPAVPAAGRSARAGSRRGRAPCRSSAASNPSRGRPPRSLEPLCSRCQWPCVTFPSSSVLRLEARNRHLASNSPPRGARAFIRKNPDAGVENYGADGRRRVIARRPAARRGGRRAF